MLRLLALLLVCLVLPVRALTLTPVAGELRHPWGLAFLPDGGYLVSERPGRLLRIDAGGNRHVVSGLPPLAATGQGGLLDLALDSDGWLYLSYSEPGDGGAGTAVARARLQKDALVDWQLLFRQQPKVAGGAHFGSRLVLTDDGYLFITLGDRYSERERAQTLDNHLGKTVRLHKDGRVPADNPFVKTPGPCRRSGAWAIATCRGRPCVRAASSSGPTSTAPRAGTRSTSSCQATTTAGPK